MYRMSSLNIKKYRKVNKYVEPTDRSNTPTLRDSQVQILPLYFPHAESQEGKGKKNLTHFLFLQPIYTESIPEDVPVNTVLLRVKATDEDTGTNSLIKYSLHGVGSQDFSIDQDTGMNALQFFFLFSISRSIHCSMILTKIKRKSCSEIKTQNHLVLNDLKLCSWWC